MAKGHVNIIGSNLNLPPKQAATWGVAAHKRAMTAAGYDGMAYYPVRGRMAAELLLGVPASDLIAALHQPWREATLADIAILGLDGLAHLRSDPEAAKAAIREAIMNAGMPRLEGSNAKLLRMGHRLGGAAVPMVVHPFGQMLGDGSHRDTSKSAGRDYHAMASDPRAGSLQWQPSADFAHNRGVLVPNQRQTAALMAERAESDGLDEAAFDTNHAGMVRRDGHRFSDPEAIAGWFAENGKLGVFEFAIQPRFGGDADTLRQVLDGNIADTAPGRMLAAAASSMPAGADFEMKVEIPDYAFTDTEGRGLGMANSLEGHQQLVPILRDFAVNNLPAS
jgi:hypothetical protein